MTSNPPAIIRRIGSTGFTVACILLAIVLVVVGTLAQVNVGTFAAQQIFFNSWFVVTEIAGLRIPVFPGGLLIATLWLAALIVSYTLKFDFFRRHLGLNIAHIGIIILLFGQALTQLLSEETVLPLEIGQTGDFSESRSEHELAFWRSGQTQDEVVSIPVSLLARTKDVATPALPFAISVLDFYPNSRISAGLPSRPIATHGLGSKVSVNRTPITYRDDEPNAPAAFIEILHNGASLGRWLAAGDLGSVQSFSAGDIQYSFTMRPRRRYFPFSLTLNKFTHDVYPGTDIPRNFASTVRLANPSLSESREVLIYMNHPLRYQGFTFYQASYGKNDTLSIFQVVENPVWVAPYLACILVTVGLLMDLATRFLFNKRPNGTQ